MIMYAWKQYGNDFRNGDDAVFWDSNRPRDENGTKIRPWLQGDKWKFREANKDTDFSDILLKWYSDVQTSVQNWTVYYEIPVIRKKWQWKSDRVSGWYPEAAWSDESASIWVYDNEFHNNPNYLLVEWDFAYISNSDWGTKTKHTVCLEIVENWLYYVEGLVQYYFSYNNPQQYQSNSAYLYKERAWVMAYDNKLSHFTPSDFRTYRAVWNGDQVAYNSIQYIKAWTKLLPFGACYQPNNKNWLMMGLHLVRLW